jgi:hypothetical protein
MAQLTETTALSATDNQDHLEVWLVELDNSTIKFNEPLLIPPVVLDQGTTEACYFAEFPELGISAVGIDIEELQSCLRSDIRMTWKRVFSKSENELTQKDRAIRLKFLELAEEVNDG